MTMRRKIGLVAAICGALFFGFRACKPVSASAVDKTLTPAQTRALLGDSIPFTYFNGSDYVTGTLEYLTDSCRLMTEDANGNPYDYFVQNTYDYNLFNDIVKSDSQYVCYYGTFSDVVIGSGTYYTAQIQPRIQFDGVTLTKFVAGFSADAEYRNTDPRYAPYDRVSYLVNGNSVANPVFYASSGAANRIITFEYRLGQSRDRWFTLSPIYYNDSSQAIISDITVMRQGDVTVGQSNRTIRFLVQCPTLSETGTVSDGSGSGSTGTDLTATNIKLDTIISLLSQIAENTQDSDDDSESVPDASEYEVPVVSVPEWFDEAMTLHKASFDVTVDGSPIFGLVPTEDTEVGEPTAGGQLFSPNTQDGVSLVPADPSNGGVLQSMRFFWALLADLVETMPIISKLITLFIGASIASWLIFGGRGS